MEGITTRVETLLKQKKDLPNISQQQLSNAGLTGVILRDYQLRGVQWLYQCFLNGNGCILGDEMGLGKTVQIISLLLHIKWTGMTNKPYLVICPLSVIGNWQTEFSRFAPSLSFLCFTGDKEKRAQLKERFPCKNLTSNQQTHVIITTYEMCVKESSYLKNFSWEVLVVDEAHRLKNHLSVLYQELIQFDHKIAVLLTGTPIQNKLSELYSLLSFVAPKIFPVTSLDQFLTNFSDVTNLQQESLKLQRLLQPFLLRRVKSEVHLDLPKKSEVVLFTGMSELQKKYYKALLLKDYGAFKDDSGNRTRLLNILMQLRKCANHPYLFNGAEPEPFTLGEHLVEASGKLQVIDQLLRFLKKRNHKVLLFSQMTTMLDIIQDYLGFRGYPYERLDGSVRGEERYLVIKNFNETEDTFIFLLSTRAGGVGLNLVSADTVIFVDSDFNPQNDLQAAARAHRIGQTREVRVIRLLARSTVDEIFFKRAQEKLKLTTAVVEGGKFSHGSSSLVTSNKAELADLLKFGFDKLTQSDESELTDEDLTRILGSTRDGEWTTRKESSLAQEAEEELTECNMYVYEGRDYSRETTEADKTAFDKCLKDLANVETTERGSRRKGQPLMSLLPEGAFRKRREFTPEELEERKLKREEAMARKAKLKEQEEKEKAEKRKQKMKKLWLDNDYTSLNVSLKEETTEEGELAVEDEEQEEAEGREIKYVIGDVTNPLKTGGRNAIIVHCVDNSGKWGTGGLFSAVSKRSSKPESCYEMAGRMNDLNLGDTHLIPLVAGENEKAKDFVALIIAQSRDRHQRVSSINMAALSEGLRRVHQAAVEMNASVHLPRIGYATPSFNWYGTERLIKKHIASKKTPTYVYYFTRKGAQSVPSTSKDYSPMSSTLSEKVGKRKIPSLPNIFSGINVYFREIPEEEKRKLSRYIIAYDGEVEKYFTSATTHVICSSSTTEGADDLTFRNTVIVYSSWIEECLRKGELVDYSGHLVAR